MTDKSRCIFCGSKQYGKNCPYSPDRLHVHFGELTRCIYCGSTSLGSGCPYSPTKKHVRGMPYNILMKDQVNDYLTDEEKNILFESLLTGYFINKLLNPNITSEIIEKKASKKIQDTSKKNQNILERVEPAPTIFDYFIGHLRDALGENKLLIIKNILDINFLKEESHEENTETFEKYKLKDKIKRKLDNISNLYYDVINEAKKSGLNTIEIEKIIFDSFLNFEK